MRLLGLLFVSMFIHSGANAFVRTMSETGLPLYWPSRGFSVQANPSNSSGLDASAIQTIFQNAVSAWNQAGGSFSIGYGQSSGVPARSGLDGSNNVYFASAAGSQMEYGVIAVTEVMYYVNSGQIVEFDMVFNDQQFQFTSSEGSTGFSSGGRTTIYLGDVATHEFGHAVGLDHSNVGRSSMIYSAFNGQFRLGNDDKAGVQTAYSSGASLGSITGNVSGTRGGMFGVHVLAINMESGQVQAGALSSPDGSFRIGDLPPGSYAVMMEPFLTSTSTVSTYYQNVDHRFCGGWANFRRGFYGACGSGVASTVRVDGGRSTAIGVAAPSCSQMGNPGGTPNSLSSAKAIPSSGGARYGTIASGTNHYYRLDGVGGSISVKVASYSLFGPGDVRVDLLNSSGSVVSGGSVVDNVENPGPGGVTNYDASLQFTGLATGTYYLRVNNKGPLSYSNFPAGYSLTDYDPHYLLMVGVNGSFGSTATTDMSACVSVANTQQNASYRAPASSEREKTSGGGCGSVDTGSSGPGIGGPMLALILAVMIKVAQASLAVVRRRR